MSFLNLFSSRNREGSSKINWDELHSTEQLDQIQKDSQEQPVLIFKHSTRCGISRMALKRFEDEYNLEEGVIKPYFLDLLAHRNISNEIASRFQVHHESPQILMIKDGKVVHHSSHHSIDAASLNQWM